VGAWVGVAGKIKHVGGTRATSAGRMAEDDVYYEASAPGELLRTASLWERLPLSVRERATGRRLGVARHNNGSVRMVPTTTHIRLMRLTGWCR
jgi:hypothetical protein